VQKKVLAVLMLAVSLTACGPNYSNGTRVGVVTKLSQKGVIWKSWEGELLIALPQGVSSATQPEKFEFNVDPACVGKVQAAMNSGKRVELIYRQWWVSPPTIDADYVVVDVKDAQ